VTLQGKLRRLDDRILGPASRRLTRRRSRQLGYGFLAYVALLFVGSFWDPTLGRTAAPMALLAGVFLGRVQEHDAAKKHAGLTDDRG
jgi:hypothetical protein